MESLHHDQRLIQRTCKGCFDEWCAPHLLLTFPLSPYSSLYTLLLSLSPYSSLLSPFPYTFSPYLPFSSLHSLSFFSYHRLAREFGQSTRSSGRSTYMAIASDPSRYIPSQFFGLHFPSDFSLLFPRVERGPSFGPTCLLGAYGAT